MFALQCKDSGAILTFRRNKPQMVFQQGKFLPRGVAVFPSKIDYEAYLVRVPWHIELNPIPIKKVGKNFEKEAQDV